MQKSVRQKAVEREIKSSKNCERWKERKSRSARGGRRNVDEKEKEGGTIKKDLRMQMHGEKEEKKRKHGSRIEGRQGINEQESEEGTSKREWKDRRRHGDRMRGDGSCGERGNERESWRGEERGPRAERRGRESDGKNQ